MEKIALKDLLYGSLLELVSNPRYYYHSVVGKEYCRLTDEGACVIVEYTKLFGALMLEAQKDELDCHSKDMLLKELKNQ